MAEKLFICEDCGKEYKTRAGLWKHQKKFKHGKFKTASAEAIPEKSDSEMIIVEEGDSSSSDDPTTLTASSETKSPAEDLESHASDHHSVPTDDQTTTDQVESAGDTKTSWRDFQFTSADDPATDVIPAHFKMAVAGGGSKGKLSKAEREALMKRNTAILKLGLTTTDHLLTKYAQAVCLDPSMEIRHSESDKDLVANAQMAYLEEKGLFLTNYLSTGVVAASLTAWYVGAPIIRIRSKAKRKLFKGKGLLSKLPLIGRFFKKKKTIETEELRIHEQ